MTNVCGRGNVPMGKSVRPRRLVDRDERAVREQVIEELEVERTRFPSSSGMLVLMCFRTR